MLLDDNRAARNFEPHLKAAGLVVKRSMPLNDELATRFGVSYAHKWLREGQNLHLIIAAKRR